MQITKINLRHNFLPLCCLSFVVILLIPIIFGVTNLDSKAVAVPLEMLFPAIGMILFVPIFQPEQNPDIEDIVASKYIDLTYVHLIRVVYSVLALLLFTIFFSVFLFFNGCEITLHIVFGTIADALLMGGIGLLTAAITNNLIVSFMLPVIYYIINVTLQEKMGIFNLFGMMREDYAPNVWLFITGLSLIALSILIKGMVLKNDDKFVKMRGNIQTAPRIVDIYQEEKYQRII